MPIEDTSAKLASSPAKPFVELLYSVDNPCMANLSSLSNAPKRPYQSLPTLDLKGNWMGSPTRSEMLVRGQGRLGGGSLLADVLDAMATRGLVIYLGVGQGNSDSVYSRMPFFAEPDKCAYICARSGEDQTAVELRIEPRGKDLYILQSSWFMSDFSRTMLDKPKESPKTLVRNLVGLPSVSTPEVSKSEAKVWETFAMVSLIGGIVLGALTATAFFLLGWSGRSALYHLYCQSWEFEED